MEIKNENTNEKRKEYVYNSYQRFCLKRLSSVDII